MRLIFDQISRKFRWNLLIIIIMSELEDYNVTLLIDELKSENN